MDWISCGGKERERATSIVIRIRNREVSRFLMSCNRSKKGTLNKFFSK